MPNVAILGCAHIHTPRFVSMMKARSTINVHYVWDHDAARAARVAQDLGSSTAATVQDVLADAHVEAIIILSETNRHEDLVIATANAGKAMFVEKPLGVDGPSAARMADVIQANKILFQTGFFMRGQAIYQTLKQHITEGSFGKLTRARGSFVHHGALAGFFDTEWRWMADPARAGVGGFGDLGAHVLDLLLWLLRDSADDVSKVTAVLDNGTARYPNCDELGEGLLRFESGLIASLAAGWNDLANPLPLALYGTEGQAYVVDGTLYMHSPKLGTDGPTTWTNLSPALPHAFELFLDALGGKDVPLVTAQEAAYSAHVMDMLYQSAKQEKWLELGHINQA
ncbi:MAG: Gfo/Idh/MocA family oxidoreductase [Deinococcota bacterium]